MNAQGEIAKSQSLPPLATPEDLRQAQFGLSLLGRVVETVEVVSLSDAVGRVTSSPIFVAPRPELELGGQPLENHAAQQVVPAGTVVQVSHLPALAASSVASIDVFARLRVGVVTMTDQPKRTSPSGSVDSAISVASGAAIVGLVKRLGATALEAQCDGSLSDGLGAIFERFLPSCDLILISGFLTPGQKILLRSSLQSADSAIVVEDISLRPIGALQIGRSKSKLVVALSADFGMAFTAFALLLSPLIRRMQGRRDSIANPACARVVSDHRMHARHWGAFPVRETSAPGQTRPTLSPCAATDPTIALAQAAGLAWRSSDTAATTSAPVAFYPFYHWLA